MLGRMIKMTIKECRIDRQAMLSNCSFVKTILMLIVVIYHSCIFWGGNWIRSVTIDSQERSLIMFPLWLNSFHIYGFTLVSGFIWCYLKQINHYRCFAVFLKSKIKRLIVPFITISVVWVIPLSLPFDRYNIMDVIYNYLLGINPHQLWFLLMLFDVFVLAWMTEPFYKKNIRLAIIVGILSYGIGLIGSHYFLDIYQIWKGFCYLPFFILGYKLYQIGKKSNPLIWISLHTGTFIVHQIMQEISQNGIGGGRYRSWIR